MVWGREVDVESRGRSYELLVGLTRVGGLNISEAIVTAGAAWDYACYNNDPVISALESVARRQGKGLWYGRQAIPPWD